MEDDIKELIRAVGRLEGAVGEIKTTVTEIKATQEENSARISKLQTRVTLTQLWTAPISFLGGLVGPFLSKVGLGTFIDMAT